MRWERAILWSFWISLAITYVATMVSIFSECKPFNNYWVVVPDPGPCSRGAKQLYIQGQKPIKSPSYQATARSRHAKKGSLNIATDLALMFLPLGVLFQVRRPLLQWVQPNTHNLGHLIPVPADSACPPRLEKSNSASSSAPESSSSSRPWCA